MQLVEEVGFSHVGLITEQKKTGTTARAAGLEDSGHGVDMGNAGSIREINITAAGRRGAGAADHLHGLVRCSSGLRRWAVPPKVESAAPTPGWDQIIAFLVRMDAQGQTFINKTPVPRMRTSGGALKTAIAGRSRR